MVAQFSPEHRRIEWVRFGGVDLPIEAGLEILYGAG
jgi:hypothetical protein